MLTSTLLQVTSHTRRTLDLVRFKLCHRAPHKVSSNAELVIHRNTEMLTGKILHRRCQESGTKFTVQSQLIALQEKMLDSIHELVHIEKTKLQMMKEVVAMKKTKLILPGSMQDKTATGSLLLHLQ